MAGKLWIPSNVILLVALVLSFLVSISLPFWSALDISRVTYENAIRNTKEFRLGTWAACYWEVKGDKHCGERRVGYEVIIQYLLVADGEINSKTVTSAWTRGLAIHPVVTGVILLALGACLSTRHTINLLAPIVCLVAAAITLIALAIDLALHIHIHVLMKSLKLPKQLGVEVTAGPALWLTVVVLILTIAAAAVLFIARRRELKGDSAYPMLSSQFQKKGFLAKFTK